MTRNNPDIMNSFRRQLNVGSPHIEHVHGSRPKAAPPETPETEPHSEPSPLFDRIRGKIALRLSDLSEIQEP